MDGPAADISPDGQLGFPCKPVGFFGPIGISS
jgi:hypothetical protein